MQRTIHPADELALIRADMQRLKEREAYLSRGFLRNSLPRRGAESLVEVKAIYSRVLRRDRLPVTVLDDPAYWHNKRVQQVYVKPLRLVTSEGLP